MFLSVENGVLLEYSGKDEHITLPDGVEVIRAGLFAENGFLRQVDFPPGIRVIGKGAFRGCSSLRRPPQHPYGRS